MSTNAPQFPDHGDSAHRHQFTVSPSPAPPKKSLGTMEVEIRVADVPEVQEILKKASTKINELVERCTSLDSTVALLENNVQALRTENKKLRIENQTLKDTLEAWQAVVRVAREKDSTLPDPESSL